MNIYYVKMLLFTFLINTLLLPQYENFINNHYNVILIPNNTQNTTIKSRLLAQTQNHNPLYHNDAELKEMIDKFNDEAIKKYLQTHDPYKQLQELVEKNGTKLTGGNVSEPMSTTDKKLLETYKDVLGEENHIMLKSNMYPNNDDTLEKSSSCECTDSDNTKLATTKRKHTYLKHLKERCTRGICLSSYSNDESYFTILNMFNETSMITAIEAGSNATVCGLSYMLTSAAASASAIFRGCGIAALILIILAIVLIILYIWLYRRRKNSWKHE
ncbi:stevor PIR protein, putative [Plasmodium sp. DRC-Itaito]|nr:stevor PIR protein, putative [Plasmodium sp. DRC-Itaito]